MATTQSDFTDSTLLFDRKLRVTIDTLLLTDLDIEFTIEKDLKKSPNNCELTIWNLNPDHRAALEQLRSTKINSNAKIQNLTRKVATKQANSSTKGIACSVEAGYGTSLSQIFLGDLRTVETTRIGPDWQTKLTSGDGEKGAQFGRVQLSYGPGIANDVPLRALARAMGVGEGNLSKVVAQLSHVQFPAGVTISGPAYRQLNTLAAGMGLTVTIQDSALQFQNIGKALSGTALKLNASKGMVDSPTVDNEGVLTVKMEMIPGVRVGSLIVMDGLNVKGQYILQKVTYAGSNFGGDFGITCQGKRY